MKNYGIFLAARSGSTRLPGKALLPLLGMPMLELIMKRLKLSTETKHFVLATTTLPADDALEKIAQKEGFKCFRGSQEDLIERFVEAEKNFPVDYVIRVTADCPFIDGDLIDYGIRASRGIENFDLFTTKGSSFPIGLDFEIYASSTMKKIHESKKATVTEREHLTLYLYNQVQEYKIFKIKAPMNWLPSGKSFTVDTIEDYQRAKHWSSLFSSPVFKINELLEKTENL